MLLPDSLYAGSYFLDRDTTEKNIDMSIKFDSQCGHRAGDQMLLPSQKGLDVTAVMSLVCEHEVFLSSVCLSRGEKYGYAAALLKNLQERISPGVKIAFYYDINCAFRKYWEVCARIYLS